MPNASNAVNATTKDKPEKAVSQKDASAKKANPVMLILAWAGKDRLYLLAATACALVAGLCAMIPYMGVFNLMAALYGGFLTSEVLFSNALLVAGGVALRCLSFGLSGALSHKGAYNALYNVRCRVVEHLAHVPLGLLGKRSVGSIKAVLSDDIEKLELFLAHNIPEFFMYLSGPVAIFIFLLTVNVPLALVTLVPLLFAFVIMGVMFRGADGLMERAAKSIGHLNAVMVEYVSGMRVIKALNMGSASFRKFREAVDEEHGLWCDMSRRMGPPYALYVVVIECGLLLMVPLGGLLFAQGRIAGDVFLLFAFVGSLYLTEIRPLQSIASTFAQVGAGALKAKELLDLPTFEGGGPFPEKCDICFDKVSFSYDDSAEVLHGVDLHIHEGERMAVVGRSGAGKSTIVELVARFHDVSAGSVRIGSVDVRAIDYEALLANCAVVFQSTFLTSGTIAQNIKMGAAATPEQIRDAARRARIHEFIESLPERYDTAIGTLGERLSGGQRQRIAIARAILKDAPLLILDEATSAVDPETQAQIDDAIAELCKGKTVIVVAHRLDVVKTCDRLAVVEDGRITFAGTHDEALRASAYYRQAWHDYRKARGIVYALDETEKGRNSCSVKGVGKSFDGATCDIERAQGRGGDALRVVSEGQGGA